MKTKKYALFLIIMTFLTLSACTGFQGANKGCSEGDNCMYYTGSRGIITHLDRPPQQLFYRSSDTNNPDANYADFNVVVRNDGPSDSYGAVFFSGVGGAFYQLSIRDQYGERPVIVPRQRQGCHIDIFGMGQIKDIGSWDYMINCFGGEFTQFGDRTNLNLRLDEIFGNLNIDLPHFLQGIDLNMQWTGGQMSSFGIGTNFGLIQYGRSLMMMILGLDFQSFGGAPFYLQGDNPSYPGGEMDYKTFRLRLNGPWPAGQDYYRLPYNIKTCYAYTTFVSPMICVDPDPTSDERKVCNDFSFTTKGSQGAPVAVTRIHTINTGSEVIVQATIRNIGPGSVWDVGYLEYCSPYYPATVTPTMKNIVYIGYMHIDNTPLTCSSYQVRLDPNTREGRITCRYDLGHTDYVGSAYATPLKMELWYGYEENIPGQITIRRIN